MTGRLYIISGLGGLAASVAIAFSAHGEDRVQLTKAPVDISFAGFEGANWLDAMAEISEAPDDYLMWADRQYSALLASAPGDASLSAEHRTLRVEMERRGLPLLD